MAFDAVSTATRIKGWFGFGLNLLSILSLIPNGPVQTIAGEANALLIALFGNAVGTGLQSTSPAIAGKHKPDAQ